MWRDVMLLSYVGGNSELWGMLRDRYFGPWGSPTLKRRRRLSTETFLQRFNGDIYIYIYEYKVRTKAKTLYQVRIKFDSFAL